ncbi:MAG: hypothetical protein AB1941_21700 [Gemmatimonadota bacterium]
MPVREFMGADGRAWRVWAVRPVMHQPLLGSSAWLCFESGTDKRRMSPVPAGWESYSAEQLAHLCRAAETVTQPG